MTPRSLAAPLALFLAVLLAACSEQAPPAAPQQQAAAPAPAAPPASAPVPPPGHPPMAGQAPAPGHASAITAANAGTVTAVEQAGGYTYLEVDSNGKRQWLASSPVQLKVGDAVQWSQGAVMRNFTSKALGRTFDELLFVSSVQAAGGAPVAAAGGMPPGHPPTPAGGNWFGDAAQRAPAAPQGGSGNRGQVVSLTQSGGYSFMEIDTAGGRQWFAASSAPVKVGDSVTWQGGMTMSNFTSNSLNRTFEQIVFVGSVSPVN